MGHLRVLPLLLLPAALAPCAGGQTLEGRLESSRDGRVGLSYAARADVCGVGTTYLRIGSGTFFGDSWTMSNGDWAGNATCERGPVRVLLTRAEGQTIGIRVGVGNVAWPAGTADVGTVPASQAAGYFLGLAARADGRLGREALLPAVLADSAHVARGLLELARNRSLSRGLREGAVGWLGYELGSAEAADEREIAAALRRLAEDGEEAAGVRTRAVSALARAEGAGTPALVALAESPDPEVRRAALGGLGRSVDPRARDVVRRAARDQNLPEPVRVDAIRAVGGRDATAKDYALLRELWPTLTGQEARGGVLDALSEAGGADNVKWLMGVARDGNQSVTDRSRAVRAAARAGASTAELVQLYDEGQDRRVKEGILESLFRIGDRAAMDKIIAVARAETDQSVRRSVVSRLARSGDPRAKDVLKGLVEQQ